MIRYITEPWTTWPRKATPWDQRRSPFQAGFQATLTQLDRELRHLRAEVAIIQVSANRLDVRQDGIIRETTTVNSSGVILTVNREGKPPLTLPCDACRRWQDNLRAIALTLEHLRGADRYGVTQSGEQYRGWEALPPPGAQAVLQDLPWALDLIARLSGVSQALLRTGPILREAAIKQARVNAHPDKGGKPTDAADVGQAAEILKKEFAG